jgi:polyisoprenoid-binding protein YceI
MPTYDPTTAEVQVFTFKEGLLSAIAHDLQIKVTAFSVNVHGEGQSPVVEARFDPTSLRVTTAMRDGAPAPSLLSDGDKRKIEGNIVDEVLLARRNPEIRFVGERLEKSGTGGTLHGKLHLGGRERALAVSLRQEGDRWIGEATLHQPDFGIKPYSAMLGTLKIKPDVRVRISLPRAAG